MTWRAISFRPYDGEGGGELDAEAALVVDVGELEADGADDAVPERGHAQEHAQPQGRPSQADTRVNHLWLSRTGARAAAWCHLIHAGASLYLSHGGQGP